MKVVILAGGLPSIIGEEHESIPKPMVKIGERPILWHIMKLYAHYGLNDFIICTGYKADIIKDYFMNYYIYQSDITVHLKTNQVEVHNMVTEPWKVSIVDTGLDTSTANRIRQIQGLLDGTFIVAYGDCLSDLHIADMIQMHRQKGKQVTVALARPSGRNAVLPTDEDGNMLTDDRQNFQAWANACTMVVEKEAIAHVRSRYDRFEIETIQQLNQYGQAASYRHYGFWRPVETMRDKIQLQQMWEEGNVPWKVWGRDGK